VSLAGALLLLAGAGAVAAAGAEYMRVQSRVAGLELKVQAARQRTQPDPAQEKRNAGLNEEAGRTAQELGIPWTRLLAELEEASRDAADAVALLSIEPDHAKHNVRITGESRDLPGALAYVERLQKSSLLRYPMLESHDVRSDDPQHPVRFAIGAEWREQP
jgi:hypothetical protein